MCKIYIVLPSDTNPNIIRSYASDDYFKIASYDKCNQVIKNRVIYNVIPDTPYIGLGEQRGVEHSKNYYKNAEC